MALIKRAESDPAAHVGIALNLGDLARRGEMMREAAIAEAQRIVAEARAERERIVEGAAEAGRAEGYEAGHAEGLAAGREVGERSAFEAMREQLETISERWTEVLDDVDQRRDGLMAECRRSAVELAAAIAERVVHRAVELDPSLVEDQMRELLSLVVAPSTLIVTVHPDDEEILERALPALTDRLAAGIHVRRRSDSSVSRGSVSARTPGGATIDATLETQLERVVRELLPGSAGDSSSEAAA